MRRHVRTNTIARMVSASAMLLLSHAAGASPQMISVVFSSPAQNPQQVGADTFRNRLMASSGGRFVVDERGGYAIGSENTVMAATRSGAIDIAVISGGVTSAVVPQMNVFDIPFLFRDEAHAKAVMQGPVAAKIAVKFADKGLVLLAIGKQGLRNITNSKRAIRVPADVRGLSLRVVPNEIREMAFEALGAKVVPMDFPLVYGALKDGRLDGEENPVGTIAASHFDEVQKYLTMTEHIFSPIAFVANREMYEQLDQADRETLLAAALAASEVTWQAQQDVPRLQQLRASGMEIIEKIDRQAFVDALKPLEPEFEKRFGKELLAAIRSTH